MGCTMKGHKKFLQTSCVALLVLGVIILGVASKMKTLADKVVETLDDYTMDGKLFLGPLQGVIDTSVAVGFFMSLASVLGYCSACYEIGWMVIVHVAVLAASVLFETCTSISVIIIRNRIKIGLETISATIALPSPTPTMDDETESGDRSVEDVLFSDFFGEPSDSGTAWVEEILEVVDYFASPVAFFMLLVAAFQIVMGYSAVKLAYHFSRPKETGQPINSNVTIQTVRMHADATSSPLPTSGYGFPSMQQTFVPPPSPVPMFSMPGQPPTFAPNAPSVKSVQQHTVLGPHVLDLPQVFSPSPSMLDDSSDLPPPPPPPSPAPPALSISSPPGRYLVNSRDGLPGSPVSPLSPSERTERRAPPTDVSHKGTRV